MLTTRRKIALARTVQKAVMAGRGAWCKGPRARVQRRGVAWDLDLREGIDFAIWLMGTFEPATVAACARLVRPGDIVFDIGANIGAHTLHLARAVGATGRVHAFEPTDWAREKLAANLALNPDLAARVVIVPAMLVAMRGAAPPPLYASWPLDSAVAAHPLHGGRKMPATGANAVTLDDYVASAGLTRLDFIKLDIDGFEGGALRGARATLARFRPRMVLELSPHQLAEQGDSIEDLTALLDAMSYRLATLSGRALPRDGAALRSLIMPGASLNALARVEVA